MATHSSILAWEIPCTAKPGWLHSTGLQRVDISEHTYTHITQMVKQGDLFLGQLIIITLTGFYSLYF